MDITLVKPSRPYSMEAANTSMTISVERLLQFVYMNSNTAKKMEGLMSDRTRGVPDDSVSFFCTANMALNTSHLAARRHL